MYKLSLRSHKNLIGVHEDLRDVIYRAIKITEVDFGITEGLRSESRQRELYNAGASWTMNSRHLTGHAVDVVAYIGNRVSWDWPLYFKIADAMKQAAIDLDTPLKWGGSWNIGDFTKENDSSEELNAQYIAYKKSIGGKNNSDGPHFQLPRGEYK
mgnify:CR=1 FL=1